MTLDEIEQGIARLSAEDRARLRAWLAQFDAGGAEPKADTEPKSSAEPKAEPETTASRLGQMAGRAFADFRKRMRDT